MVLQDVAHSKRQREKRLDLQQLETDYQGKIYTINNWSSYILFRAILVKDRRSKFKLRSKDSQETIQEDDPPASDILQPSVKSLLKRWSSFLCNISTWQKIIICF